MYKRQGKSLRLSVEATVPGSDLEYYVVNLESNYYYPFTRKAALSLSGDLSYGDGYGDTDGLPFFKNFFAGGTTSVRGFEPRSLGPRDELDNPFGGAKRVLLKAALLLPVGDGALDKRLQLFVDGGQVFANEEDVEFDDIRSVSYTHLTLPTIYSV